MKPVHVLVLALLACGAGLVVWLNAGNDTNKPSFEEKLFPQLSKSLDSISRLNVSDAKGSQVTIERKDGAWVVKERFKYAANTPKVGELILALADARQVEQKTANPEFYSRLGLRDTSDPESEALLITLTTPSGDLKVLAGNQSERFGGSTFVRKPDSDTSYLVTPSLSTDTDVSEWLDTGVFDIAADKIQSIKIESDGVVAEINKSAMFDAPFDLVGRDESKTLNDVAVRNLSQALTGLEFEGVIRSVAFAYNDYKRLNLTYTLFSGVIIDVTLFYQEQNSDADEDEGPVREKRYWLNAAARFDESLAQQFVPQPDDADGASEKSEFTLTAADMADRRAEAERITQTRKNWMYLITSTQFEHMNQSSESLATQN